MSGNRLKTTLRIALRLVGVGLVVLHANLLWQRVTDGSLADLAVAGQWLASALLVAGLVVVRRRTGSLFRGREAAVLWILVALLHALTGVTAAPMLATPTSLLALPFGFLAATLLAGLATRRPAPPRRSAQRWALAGFRWLALPGHAGVAGSRGPPR